MIDKSTHVGSLFSAERLGELTRLAARAPEQAAAAEELAIIKSGSFEAGDVSPSDHARVTTWNMERGRSLDQWLAMPAVRDADILLLCEVDDGMARSGNVMVPAVLAKRLGMHYAFVPNYLELTRGTRRERRATRGQKNSIGFHGNAILSRWPLHDLRRIPLPVKFDWFRHSERRIGTRVALHARVDLLTGPVSLVCAHLEAFATPDGRAEQMRALLRAIPNPPSPAIIGGDLNTLGVRPTWFQGLRLVANRLRGSKGALETAIAREPLFEDAKGFGFSWESANADAPTWTFPRSAPAFGAKLDWVLVRGLAVVPGSASVVPARGVGAKSLSDHEGLVVTVQLEVAR